ncbi:MAG TPA: ABC transporter substrate-binding protein [Chloroflexota bacterium]|nr:ABC transporter substrate-binding protein [Chloroflexota bacterium]
MYRWPLLVLVALLVLACQAPPTAREGGGRGGTAGDAAPAAAPAAPVPAAAPSAAPAPPASLETVRVGTVGSAGDANFTWAQERGYLREEGLDLETQVFNGAQVMIPPLGADQLDVGGGGPGPGLFNAILRGVNVRIVADRSRAVPNVRNQCVAVRKPLLDSGAIHSFADFRGRVFSENVPAVLTTSIIDRELKKAGVSLQQDVTSVTLSFPDMLPAFANDAIDFSVLIDPYIVLAQQQGVADCWKYTYELEPNFQIAVLIYGPAFAEQHPDAARGFMVAYLRAIRDYQRAFFGDGANRAEFLDLIGRTAGITDKGLLERIGPSWADPNGAVNVESLRETQRWYVARGDQTGEVDFDRVVDSSFADYAVSRLGREATP